ncbi:MAG: MbnP family protein [Bacteroidota bacterium]
MKKSFLFLLLLGGLFFTSCEEETTGEVLDLPGELELEFDNIALIDGIQRQIELKEAGSTEYNYTNGMGQDFNLTFLKYYISDIVLEGDDKLYYEVPTNVTATSAEGYYLIDEAIVASQLVRLEDVPAGRYNKISFTVGVEEEGVMEGAAGGVLDPSTSGMFWNWNAGYVALKIEGQSPVSPGGAFGNSITPEDENGIVFHVGGWKEVEDTPFINNNQRITLDFDTEAVVEQKERPHVHLVMDVLKIFEGDNMIDFTGNVNMHKPSDAKPLANNIAKAFAFDHIHQ